MPILWRYLLIQFFKVLGLCTIAFIGILLTLRIEEIANFATLGPQAIYVFWFTLYQIPYILPIAIPISCLISAILLIQRLSYSQELTALRACGVAFRNLLTPLLLCAFLVSLLNFYIVSELATSSHLASGMLRSQLRSLNPLLLLNHHHLIRLKGYFVETLGESRSGEFASDVIVGLPNKGHERLTLMIAKKLRTSETAFNAKQVTLISSLHSDEDGQFDHLILENIAEANTTLTDFSQMIQKKVWSLHDDHLRLPLLLVRLEDEKKAQRQALQNGANRDEIKPMQRSINRSYSEILRRISLAIAAFTFTLMGTAFGVSIGRSRSKQGIFYVVALSTLYLVGYFVGKAIDYSLVSSAIFYLAPHAIIIACSIWSLRRAIRGVES